MSSEGVQVDASKITAIVEWPKPTNLKQLRGFLGLTGYYRRFIKGYASAAAPLTGLLKKDAFHWDHKAEIAFKQLKDGIISQPVLALPNFDQPFELETDDSGAGVWAVLIQNKHPIAYF
ncbi:hypothetical protein AAHE18_14G167800 [Arachis hypogaea]